jgi:hypothetical protein
MRSAGYVGRANIFNNEVLFGGYDAAGPGLWVSGANLNGVAPTDLTVAAGDSRIALFNQYAAAGFQGETNNHSVTASTTCARNLSPGHTVCTGYFFCLQNSIYSLPGVCDSYAARASRHPTKQRGLDEFEIDVRRAAYGLARPGSRRAQREGH